MRSRWAGLGAIIAGVAYGSLGCAVLEMPGVSCRIKSERSDPQDKKGPRNYFVQLEGKGNKTPRHAVFESQLRVRPNHDSHVRYEVDPARLQETHLSQACLEIDDLSDDTSQLDWFAVICARYQAASPGPEGVLYFVNWNGVAGSTRFVAGQRFMAMRAAWNGSILSFFGLDGVVEEKVDESAFMNAGETFAGTGVSNMGKKARLRLVRLDGVSNGDIDPGASDEAKAVDAIGLASWDLLNAHEELNGPDIDYDAADNLLVDAADGLATAAARLAALPETRATKKAGKDVAKAVNLAGKARVQIDKQKQKAAIKKVQKAFKFASRAANGVSPILLGQ